MQPCGSSRAPVARCALKRPAARFYGPLRALVACCVLLQPLRASVVRCALLRSVGCFCDPLRVSAARCALLWLLHAPAICCVTTSAPLACVFAPAHLAYHLAPATWVCYALLWLIARPSGSLRVPTARGAPLQFIVGPCRWLRAPAAHVAPMSLDARPYRSLRAYAVCCTLLRTVVCSCDRMRASGGSFALPRVASRSCGPWRVSVARYFEEFEKAKINI